LPFALVCVALLLLEAPAASGAEPLRILAYGDSNTWGWIPVEHGYPTIRYAAGKRWPGVLRETLGPGYEVIEEGLSGRTTDLPDPTAPQIGGAGLDGSAYLPAALASHAPLDLVVIMLGTNDLKTAFERSPEEIAAGICKLVRIVTASAGAAWTTYPAPRALVLAPPPLRQTARFPAEAFESGVEKSRQLAGSYATAVSECGAEYFDVGLVTSADGVDGLHLSEAAHTKIGLAVAGKVRTILN
jgi:lysophospholipase L1-like esterase